MNSILRARTPAKYPAERRLNIRLLNYWQSLRGEHRYPSIDAGARISAGKSGKVARSFPDIAVDWVNWLPAN